MPEHREPRLGQEAGHRPKPRSWQGSGTDDQPAGSAVGQQCLGVTGELACVSQLGVQLSPVPAQWQVGNRGSKALTKVLPAWSQGVGSYGRGGGAVVATRPTLPRPRWVSGGLERGWGYSRP